LDYYSRSFRTHDGSIGSPDATRETVVATLDFATGADKV